MVKNKRVTIKDIATKLNVSLSTVNKALTGKNKIGEERRRQIIETANLMGYKVNKVAQSLARNTLKIGIIIPSDWPQFYNYMENGIKSELDSLNDYNVKGIFRYYSHKQLLPDNINKSLSELISEGISALILCPAGRYNYESVLYDFKAHNIPVILLGNDLPPYAKRLTSIRVNAALAGKMAAEIVKWLLPHGKSAAIFIGNKDIEVHREKVEGFLEEASLKKGPGMNIAGVFETQDDPEIAYFLTKKLFDENPEVGAIYVATGNSGAVCKFITENNLKDRVKIVGTDIFKEQIDYMEQGIVAAIIHQNSYEQGKIAVKTVYSYISEGKIPDEAIFVTPQIALRNNVKYFLN